MKKPKVVNLFSTKNYSPILNHRDLERVLNRLGFFGAATILLPSSPPPPPPNDVVVWREYHFTGGLSSTTGVSFVEAPLPRLPYPKMDMLHVDTYRVFVDALGRLAGHEEVQNHIHIRGMPCPASYEKGKMQVGVWPNDGLVPTEQVFVYRKGSHDEAIKSLAAKLDGDVKNNNDDGSARGVPRRRRERS